MSAPLILMYHAFGERSDASDPYRVFVPAPVLDRQLGTLQERGAHFLDLDGYLAGLPTRTWPARSVLVTIDDGYTSTLTDAAPVLARRRVPAVLFALAGRLEGCSDWMPGMPSEPLLGLDGLRELEAHGVRTEVHGWDHRLLPGLPPDELHRQVAQSRAAFADLLGRPPVAYAYASGAHDVAARAAVRRAGYTCAFAVHAACGPYALQRVDVNPTDTDTTFRMKTQPWWPLAYRTAGRLAPLRRGIHLLVGSARGAGTPDPLGAAEQELAASGR